MMQQLPESFKPIENKDDTDNKNKDLSNVPSFQPLSDALETANKPLVSFTPEAKAAASAFTEENPVLGNIGQFGTGLLESLTSPLSLGLTAATFGSGAAAKAGLTGISKALEIPGAVAGAGMTGHGLYNAIEEPSLGGKIGGAAEAGLGILGLRSNLGRIRAKPEILESQDFSKLSKGDVQKPQISAPSFLPAIIQKEYQDLSKKMFDIFDKGMNGNLTAAEIEAAQSIQEQWRNNPLFNSRGAKLDRAKTLLAKGGMKIDNMDDAALIDTAKRAFPEMFPDMPNPKFRLNRDGSYTPIDNTGKPVGSAFKPKTDPLTGQESVSIDMSNKDLSKAAQNSSDKKMTKFDLMNEVINFPKALKATWDLSAPFRQGVGLITRPEYWKNFNTMFKTMGSEEYFLNINKSIESLPSYKLARESGLAMTGIGDNLALREELYFSKLADKIPGVRASERAYVGFLNKLRADTFDTLVSQAKAAGLNPETDKVLSDQLANYVNTATGRGNLGRFEKNAVGLNQLLFSPRLIASRLKLGTVMFTPSTYTQMPPFVRKQYLRSLFGIAALGTTTGALAKVSGADVSLDPESSDFGKVKVGNTRFDPWAGNQQYLVAAARFLIAAGQGDYKKFAERSANTFGVGRHFPSFTENKLSPLMKFADDMLSGRAGRQGGLSGNIGNVTSPPVGDVANLFMPMIIDDIVSLAKEDPKLIPLAIPAGFGMGVQTYQDQTGGYGVSSKFK